MELALSSRPLSEVLSLLLNTHVTKANNFGRK